MADDPSSLLSEAKRTADALQSATRFLGKKPDFYGCGGPAAEAYWEYFTPARISSLLAAVEAALKLADEWEADSFVVDPEVALRAAITGALGGTEAGDG